MRFFVRVTDPILKFFRPITPKFLVRPVIPLFVAWIFYMVRFYLMPLLLGFGVMGTLSFSLEGDIAQMLGKLLK